MGQKVHPNLIRLGIINNWYSNWYANKRLFPIYLKNDFKVRNFLRKFLFKAFVSHIVIERPNKNILVTIYTSRPGIVIGKKGSDVEKLRKNVSIISGVPAKINIFEIRKPELNAKLVADSISSQLKKRMVYKRVMKRSIQNVIKAGAKGVKIEISGRLGGTDIARTEWSREGRIPLHTFRANIDFNLSTIKTTYGIIGIKVWIFKGEILKKK